MQITLLKKSTVAAAAIAASMMFGGSAHAATVPCDTTIAGKVTGTSACEYSDAVNNDSPLDDFLAEGWFMISDWDFAAKDDTLGGTNEEGSGLVITQNATSDALDMAGLWQISGYSASSAYMLVFKGPRNAEPAALVSYLASAGNGTYETMFFQSSSTDGDGTVTYTGGQEISHISLYTKASPIPLPAAGWLLLAGIGGLAAFRRRKSV